MTNNLQVFLNLRNEFTRKCNDGKCLYTFQHPEYGTQCDSPDKCKRFADLQNKVYIVLTLLTKEERIELRKINGENNSIIIEFENDNEYQSYLDQERQKMIDKLPKWVIDDLDLII